MDQSTGRQDAPVLLLTKLHPPSVPAQTVARERLFERLRGGRGRRLTLVAGPAGFGKSTLLAAWRASEAERRPVAWVTLDEGDDDAVVLWSHAVEALCRACPALPHEALAGAVMAAPLLEVALPRLVNELIEVGEVVLVLDDFHRLSSPGARESVTWFVDHLPAGVQLVLSTRVDPALPLGALRARGQLLELRADDLRFTAAEADEFLNGRLGLALAEADVELLVARTEGWPAGIYLAALSLADNPDKAALVRAFDGTSAHVVDFLSSEVLGGYDPELQTFMLRTSVLERLCVPLCDAVLGERGVGRRARDAGAHEPVPAAARRPAALVPLPPPVRPAAAGRARAARAGARARAAPARLRLAQRVGHHRGGDPARHRGRRVRRGRRPDRGDLGALRQRRPHLVGARVAAAHPRRGARCDRRLLLVSAWIAALRGDEAGMRDALARFHALGGEDDGPLPDGFASLGLERVGAARGVRVGRRRGGRWRRGREPRSSRGRSRRGGRWSRGRSGGATTAAASSTSRRGG